MVRNYRYGRIGSAVAPQRLFTATARGHVPLSAAPDAMPSLRRCRILVAACMLAAAPFAMAETTLVLYSEAGQRPLSFEENGMPKGAYIENLNRILKRIPDFEVAPDATLEVKVGAAAMIPALPLVWRI